MSLLDSKPILPEFIKLRWQEPYVSAGLNRKTFKSLPRGFYSGFIVRPGPGALNVTVHSDDPLGWGSTSGYSEGAFDAASGWSIGVHESLKGFTSTVAIQAGVSGNTMFDLSSYAGQSVYLALHVFYDIGYATSGGILVLEPSDLDSDPTKMVIARVNVPSVGSIADANIIYDDPVYPRVLPFADRRKYGFMSKIQAEILEILASDAVSGAPLYDEEVDITVDGPQDIILPGGQIYVVGSRDLMVVKNTGWARVGASRDYIEVDRGDGFGEKITWVGGNLRSGDRIRFRVQKYAAGLNSTVHVMDEGALIEQNVAFFNFTGPGVSVLPDGYRRVRVSIPGGGGASATKVKFNASGALIPSFRAVHLRGDNTIIPCDPTVSGHKLYGVTIQNIPNNTAGDVIVAGIVAGGGAQVSGSPVGSDVYVSHLGDGSLTASAPDPVSGSVFRVGISDGVDSVSGGVATDIVFDRGRLA